ncbi:hypothetical protein ACEWY4_010849 [Coilia grayii]|uniref:Cadherin domain-containing protein n=1 Tax=Coilia grayii TaxID=363190 RepID=A0ABD1K343_9TELE
MTGDPETNEISLELTGDNADWLYLEGKTIRLNTTLDQDLDREIYGSVLKAFVSCYVNDTLQSEYGLVVEVLNENDNEPVFLWNTTQAQNISELTAVNTVIFALQALDGDGDTIIYEIDDSSPDAEHFRIDLPNSGQVLLNKPLDYESQMELRLRVYAVEMNTKEQLNATATLVVYVQDGDDHYPQFLPCTVLPLSGGTHVCANPVYITNITERDQDIVLDFYPGPVNAVDGDKALNTPLIYSILSGADDGRFLINGTTGEITLTRAVENRLLTPSLRLRIMAAQVDDLKKYSVATAIVRVVAENRFPPQFQRREYRAFLTETANQATFVLTYGNELLILQAIDQDFPDGMNPRVQYSLATDTELFSITKEGFLIARGNHPPPPHTYKLEVLATDLESGDVANASVTVTILHRGQPVPHSPLSEDPHYGQRSPGRAVGVLGLGLLLLGAAVCATVRWHRRRKQRQKPANRGCLAEGKDPNVSLQWFQLVNHSCPVVLLDEVSLNREALFGVDATQSPLHGRPGIYTVTEKLSSSSSPWATAMPLSASSAIRSNGKASDKPLFKSVSFRDEVTIRTREMDDEEQEQGADTYPDGFVVDVPLKEDGSSLARDEGEPNMDKPIQSQPCTGPKTSQDASLKQKNTDTPQTHTDRKEESKAEQKTTDDPQQSQSHTDIKPGQTPHTEVGKGKVNDQKIQLIDLKECTEIPETSSNAVMIAGQSTQSPEVQHTHTSTHTHGNTLTQPHTPSTPTPQAQQTQSSTPTRDRTFIKLLQPNRGPSSEPKATDVGSHGHAHTLAPTHTSSEQTATDVSKDSANISTATPTSSEQQATDVSKDSAKTSRATPTSSEQKAADASSEGSVNIAAATPTSIEQKAADACSEGSANTAATTHTMPDIIITGSGDMEKEEDEEEEDNIEKKFTKVTNLDDDVTDPPSKDGAATETYTQL